MGAGPRLSRSAEFERIPNNRHIYPSPSSRTQIELLVIGYGRDASRLIRLQDAASFGHGGMRNITTVWKELAISVNLTRNRVRYAPCEILARRG